MAHVLGIQYLWVQTYQHNLKFVWVAWYKPPEQTDRRHCWYTSLNKTGSRGQHKFKKKKGGDYPEMLPEKYQYQFCIVRFLFVSRRNVVDPKRRESKVLWATNLKKKKKKKLLHLLSWDKKRNPSWGQSGLDCVTPGGRTRCSSILLDWERRMRLKKSSSGTVGPLFADGGAAHLWSFSREP